MFLAEVRCPGCKAEYEATVKQVPEYVPCPGCGQRNATKADPPPIEITGFCRCGRAIDDHIWQGSTIAHCP